AARHDLHDPVAADAVRQQLGLDEPLAAERLDRIAPQLRDLHRTVNAEAPRALPRCRTSIKALASMLEDGCGDPVPGRAPGRRACAAPRAPACVPGRAGLHLLDAARAARPRPAR